MSNKYLPCYLAWLLTAISIASCNLPKELDGTDTLSAPEKFTNIPDSTQATMNVPAWRNFFQDTLLVHVAECHTVFTIVITATDTQVEILCRSDLGDLIHCIYCGTEIT